MSEFPKFIDYEEVAERSEQPITASRVPLSMSAIAKLALGGYSDRGLGEASLPCDQICPIPPYGPSDEDYDMDSRLLAQWKMDLSQLPEDLQG
jgi:hypothetical protein